MGSTQDRSFYLNNKLGMVWFASRRLSLNEKKLKMCAEHGLNKEFASRDKNVKN